VEETGVPRENHGPVADKLYLIKLCLVHLAGAGFELTSAVIMNKVVVKEYIFYSSHKLA
jgi:hypothetical protein